MVVHLKKKQKRLVKEIYRRVMSGVLAFVMLLTSYIPFPSYALTGGPSQPEVQGFTPIGTSDMVDLFSGDFKYNIPLLSVDGYPINIAYSGNVSMDQEASWVGLGWNLNVGTVNRMKRGLPDDFNGEDELTTVNNMKPQRNLSIGVGVKGELIGFDTDNVIGKIAGALGLEGGLNAAATLSFNHSNYHGMGVSLGLNLNVEGENYEGGLGINSSSSEGLTIQPSAGFRKEVSDHKRENILGNTNHIGISSSFNTRGGLTSLSVYSTQESGLIVNDQKTKTSSYSKQTSGGSSSFGIMQPTFTPQIINDITTFSFSGSFAPGPSLFGGHLQAGRLNVAYSQQTLKNKNEVTPAYGYMNLNEGQGKEEVAFDFNRENDGQFSTSTPAANLTNLAYDIFSVSGQGNGGSYRPYRNDVGRVYDAKGKTFSFSGQVGVELGAGASGKTGTDLKVNTVTGRSGDWSGGNLAQNNLKYKGSHNNDVSGYFMKDASEMNVSANADFINQLGGYKATAIKLKKNAFNTVAEAKLISNSGTTQPITVNNRLLRERRNNNMQILTRGELSKGYGLEDLADPSSTDKKDHHIGEIRTLGADGSRYVYGLAAYNLSQKEESFAVGSTNRDILNPCADEDYDCDALDYGNGLITYSSTNRSSDNKKGIDNYYNSVETPAYAHSYLLTAIISPDYVDIDGVKGPSIDDLGSWTKFSYNKTNSAYRWRVPIGADQAAFSEMLKTDATDDRASIIEGTKELYYIDKIETKNFVATFELEDRHDGYGTEPDGSRSGLAAQTTKCLTSISLYTRQEYEANISNLSNAIPIKVVHFEYDYSLCQGIPNNDGDTYDPNSTGGNLNQGGKLTLKRIYFTYRGSKKGKISPYAFEYNSDTNYDYNLKGYDRWGNYKPNPYSSTIEYYYNVDHLNDPLSNSDFPYVQQEDEDLQDAYASAWTLEKINLPSGGDITIELETDDYTNVQDRKAAQMYKIVDVGNNNNTAIAGTSGNSASLSDSGNKNRRIYFEMPSGSTIDELVEGYNPINENDDDKFLYFKFLSQFKFQPEVFQSPEYMYEFVPGYAKIEDYGTEGSYGWILLEGVDLSSVEEDKGNPIYNPMARTGIQYGRLHLAQYIFNDKSLDEDGFDLLLSNFVNVIGNFVNGFRNPNKMLWSEEKGTRIVLNKSYIRLNASGGEKLGGGNRVKSIEINDNWSVMTNNINEESSDYGQTYLYELENGQSSGVASYEPQIGGDENPFRHPVFYDSKKLMAPDSKFYQEEPFGESFFPSASVGYSRVVVKNKERNFTSKGKEVSKHATGFVEHEFYTTKEFPTLTSRTELEMDRPKNDAFGLQTLFKLDSKDFLTISQGFYIETNDMNGKPKAQRVYQELASEPITSVEYNYKQVLDPVTGKNRVDNTVEVLNADGSSNQAEIGVHFDGVTDWRENKTLTTSTGMQLGLDITPIPPLNFLPSWFPVMFFDRTRFRSVTFTKVVQRFGVLESTVATDLGSKVETKNLAYDAITGQVLLTQTQTNFEDAVYTLQYPAYWYYDQMGPAYQNIGITRTGVVFSGGIASLSNAHLTFVEGDELIVDDGTTAERAWVVGVDVNEITVMLKDGTFYSGTAFIKIVRSGRRNQQMNPMASVTTRINPLQSFQSNVFENVIQASAIEFSNEWRTYCDCLDDGAGGLISANPYVIGTKGNWRPITSYLHLSQRTQSKVNDNTNIRQDGFFESYTPFYKLNNGGHWEIDRKDWTYTAEVTEFNPFGQELENRDALGRYSAATFGFNQTLATSVGANTQYRELGFDSFEDYDFSNCSDGHFKFNDYTSNVTSERAHSGDYSIKVTSGNEVSMSKDLEWCPKPGCDLDISYSIVGDEIIFSPVNAGTIVISDYNEISAGANIVPSPSTGTISYRDYNIDGIIEIIFVSEGCHVAKTFIIDNGQITLQ